MDVHLFGLFGETPASPTCVLWDGLAYALWLFWLEWTRRANIHWIVPMMSGVPFGFGIIMACLNYTTDAMRRVR
ncbi:hypothetical protein BDZ91DRAFT_715875 [Kalaharituber pfeilii]|nr:hypothetical protein BDZ91DRAFT_729078 [Kalaharituber pfeilii]KAF8472834.1 hypothetical protein BDZ91DRAFT_715875 [Kalaharituber pfeilii]